MQQAAYTLAALFDDYKDARSAVREIEAEAGVAAVSLIANNAGARYGTSPQPRTETGAAADSALAGIGAMAIPGIGPALAAGPAAAALRQGLGLVAALAAVGIPRAPAGFYAEAVRRGASLVAAQVAVAERNRVSGLLAGCGPVDLAERAAEWRREGWQGFDESGAPHPGPYYGSAPTLSGAPADHPISPGHRPESGPPGGWTIRREGPVGADWNTARVQIFAPAEEEIPGKGRA